MLLVHDKQTRKTSNSKMYQGKKMSDSTVAMAHEWPSYDLVTNRPDCVVLKVETPCSSMAPDSFLLYTICASNTRNSKHSGSKNSIAI